MKKIQFLLMVIVFFAFGKTRAQAPDWLWAKSIGGKINDEANSVAVDITGNIFVTGYFQDTVDFDPGPGIYNLIAASNSVNIFVAKYESSGIFSWAKQLGGSTYGQGTCIK